MQEWLADPWYSFCYSLSFGSLFLGNSFRMDGRCHVPTRGPALVIANHQSFIDPVLIGLSLTRPMRSLARKSLFRNRFLAWLMRSVGGMPIDQDGSPREGITAGLEVLKAGKLLVLFPEGERTHTGSMQPFKAGIALLVQKAQVPVLPVGIAGAYDAWPRTRPLPRFSPIFYPATDAAIAVSVGPPLDYQQLKGLDRPALLSTMFEHVQQAQRRAESIRRKR